MSFIQQQIQRLRISEEGFTLAEVLVTLAVISLLLLIGLSGAFADPGSAEEKIAARVPDPSKVENTMAQAEQAEAVAMKEGNERAAFEEATKPPVWVFHWNCPDEEPIEVIHSNQ